jgi:hypothetical protein
VPPKDLLLSDGINQVLDALGVWFLARSARAGRAEGIAAACPEMKLR